MDVGKQTVLGSVKLTWPHKICIGNGCTIERNCHFKHDGIWSEGFSILIGNNVFIGTGCEFNVRRRVAIGNDSLIASGCKFIDHDHGTSTDILMRVQEGPESEIAVGENVWLGCNVVVLKGVQIGDGAIVAAGAVVTRNIPKNEVWAGVPAKKIAVR